MSKNGNNVIKLNEICIECPECGDHMWYIHVDKVENVTKDDITDLECANEECGYMVNMEDLIITKANGEDGQ